MNEKNARRPEGSTSATPKRNFRAFPAGLFAEWAVIAVVCAALLLLSVVVR